MRDVDVMCDEVAPKLTRSLIMRDGRHGDDIITESWIGQEAFLDSRMIIRNVHVSIIQVDAQWSSFVRLLTGVLNDA